MVRPSHTEGLTSGRPPMTKIVTDHQRASATMGPPKMLQSHLFGRRLVTHRSYDRLATNWSGRPRFVVGRSVTVSNGRRLAAIRRSVGDRSPTNVQWSVDKRRLVADWSSVLKTGRQQVRDRHRRVANLLKTSC